MSNAYGDKVIAKVAWRIVPFIMLIAVVNYIDRSNVAFAALQMNKDLGFGPAVYGFGAGVFFIGYCIFEVPSNLILVHVGVRRWLARIMISWGVVAAGTAFVTGDTSFYVMRFLLGVAEAGFLPAIMYYLRSWLPGRSRAKILGIFMSHTAIANMIGGPLSTWLMTSFDGAFGLHGWQIMFLAEGLPAVLLGVLVLYLLTNTPGEAEWLYTEEKSWLTGTLTQEIAAQGSRAATTLRQGLLDQRVLLVMVMFFFLIVANFGIVFWLPQIIKAFGGLTNVEVGLLSALPYALACAAMILWGRHSDQTGDRKWHLASGMLVGAAGLTASALAPTPITSFIGLCVAALGIWSVFGICWAIPADFLSGRAAAGGLALINSFATIGGFVGPFLIGFFRERTGSFTVSLLILAGSAVITAILATFLRNEWRREDIGLSGLPAKTA